MAIQRAKDRIYTRKNSDRGDKERCEEQGKVGKVRGRVLKLVGHRGQRCEEQLQKREVLKQGVRTEEGAETR